MKTNEFVLFANFSLSCLRPAESLLRLLRREQIELAGELIKMRFNFFRPTKIQRQPATLPGWMSINWQPIILFQKLMFDYLPISVPFLLR